VAVIESMKMQHVVAAEQAGQVLEVRGTVGEIVPQGRILAVLQPQGAWPRTPPPRCRRRTRWPCARTCSA
jgi:pyruvate/2-oxoglutarate dehydrogenase complex dihydrolipoamide acyltransferase (E2) component